LELGLEQLRNRSHLLEHRIRNHSNEVCLASHELAYVRCNRKLVHRHNRS